MFTGGNNCMNKNTFYKLSSTNVKYIIMYTNLNKSLTIAKFETFIHGWKNISTCVLQKQDMTCYKCPWPDLL